MSTPPVPNGLNMRPKPPSRAKYGRRPAHLILGGLVLIVALVGTGVYFRMERNRAAIKVDEETTTVTAASAEEVTKGIPPAGNATLLAGKKPPAAAAPAVAPPPPTGPIGPPPSLPVIPPPPDRGERARLRAAMPAMTADEAESHMNKLGTYQPASPEERKLAATRGGMGLLVKENSPEIPTIAPGGLPASPMATQRVVALPAVAQTTGGMSVSAKLAFLNEAGRQKTLSDQYLHQQRTSQVCTLEIKAGWDLPAVLAQRIDSDLPARTVKAVISQSVFDSTTGKHLLFPQGTTLVGAYDDQVVYGQSRVLMAWDRAIFPDGSSLTLEGMQGIDSEGRAGVSDKVDRHYKRLFGMAVLTSAIMLPAEIASRRSSQSYNGYPSAADTATATMSREMSMTGTQVFRQNMGVAPTLKISAGTKFSVRVAKDICFAEAYTPYQQPEPPAPAGVRRVSR